MNDVEVAVNTILEVTMIHPDVIAGLDDEIVACVEVACTCTLEGDVTHNNVSAVVQLQNTTFVDSSLFCLVGIGGWCVGIGVLKHRAWQTVYGFVLSIADANLSVDDNDTFYIYSSLLASFHRFLESICIFYNDRILVIASCCSFTDSGKANWLVSIILGWCPITCPYCHGNG